MGNRIGYRIRDGQKCSLIFRKQWSDGVEEPVVNTWKTLLDGKAIKDGSCALREDLDWGRAFAAFIFSNYKPPFESIEENTDCDINDNGLIEINIEKFDHWKIYHCHIGNLEELYEKYGEGADLFKDHKDEMDWGKIGEPKLIAEMTVKGFKWLEKKAQEELG